MGSISGDELSHSGSLRSSANEERIFVSVRLRPLNDKELARNDVSDWECTNSNTVVFKNNIVERSMYPTAYTFDGVFGCDTSTKQVYEESAKEVALSVVRGINSTIFAYGQTSSGKTYTMSGVTERTVADIFDYIEKHNDREYILKFSAIEIYNESVRDLLSQDNTPLRLLDDPERGTVVEKLTEETVKDWSHLKDLLSVCEAQRQIGETSLNEVSSRSHQILRLTIESSSIEFLGGQKSSVLAASVNLVDLAGSERASQAMSAGTRLKEGCHINRSLLTLGTVIRKLSKARNGHIPYRDSKLTRILQNSLGGNARTAIICTMSPARTHVEQSRNTLLFASCAKEVSTNAQANLVVSDKSLVKQLQRELAKLESELKLVMPKSDVMLKERTSYTKGTIMENEIKELKKERDLALSRVQDLLGSGSEYQASRPVAEDNLLLKQYAQHGWVGESSTSESSDIVDRCILDVKSGNSDEHFLSDETSPREEIEKLFGPDPSKGWEMSVQKQEEDYQDQYKDVQCIEETKREINSNSKSNKIFLAENTPENLSEINMSPKYEALTQKIKKLEKTISYLFSSQPVVHNMYSPRLIRSRSCSTTSSQLEKKKEKNENTPPNVFEIDFLGRLKSSYTVKGCKLKFEDDDGNLRRSRFPISFKAILENEKKLENQQRFEADALSVARCVNELNEEVSPQHEQQLGDEKIQEIKPEVEVSVLVSAGNSKPKSKPKPDELAKSTKTKEILDIHNPEITSMSSVHSSLLHPTIWQAEFERQRREIIEFWDVCNVPLSHRTHFFLLFKGDLSDSAYMEVELRRLTFLRSKLFLGTLVIDGQIFTLALSKKALERERRMLSKQIRKRFSTKEREALFQKWDIDSKSKQRRKQLCSRIWTDTKDMKRINGSAALVAKLIGFSESDQYAKEMFGFNILPGKVSRAKSLSWA